MTIEDPVEYMTAGIDQIEVNPRAGPHVRPRTADDPPLRSRRHPRRRDPRRGDGADRRPGGDDGSPRVLHAPLADSGVGGPAAYRHGRRARPPGGDADMPRVTAARAAGLRRLQGDVPGDQGAISSRWAGRTSEPAVRQLARGAGCAACGGTGYKGRIALFEVLTFTEELRELIAGGASTVELQRAAVASGMRPLFERRRPALPGGRHDARRDQAGRRRPALARPGASRARSWSAGSVRGRSERASLMCGLASSCFPWFTSDRASP